MSTPWRDNTVKHIQRITHGTQPNLNNPGAALPPIPPPQTLLAFNGARLRGSLAIAMILSHASAARAAAVAASTAQFLAEFVDDALPVDLAIVRDAMVLSDVGRTLLSSLLGAAVTDQYMLALGYRYRCNTRELISLGAAGDYLYDGLSPETSQIVMAEAKGSIVSTGRRLSIARTARRGYARQVAPHVGRTYIMPNNRIAIAHGYCVGCGAQVGGGGAIAHVEETAGTIVTAVGSGAPRRLLSFGPESAVVYTAIALNSAAGTFALLNSPRVSDALKRAAVDRQQTEIYLGGFSEIEFRGELFMAAPVTRENLGFALWKPTFEAIVELAQSSELLAADEIELPVPGDLLTGEELDGGAVLPDGLAVLPKEYFLEQDVTRVRNTVSAEQVRAFKEGLSALRAVQDDGSTQSDVDRDVDNSSEESEA